MFGASPAQDDNWPVTEIFKYFYLVVNLKDDQFLTVFTDRSPLTRMKFYNNARLLCYWGYRASIGLFSFCTTSSLIILLLFLICSCGRPPPEGTTSTTGSSTTSTVTETSTNPTTGGTKKKLSGEPSLAYKREILDSSFHCLYIIYYMLYKVIVDI